MAQKKYTKEVKQARRDMIALYKTGVPEFNPFEYKDESAYYKKLAKMADQRLAKLEEISLQDRSHYENILKFAYANAMEEIRHIRGQEYSRFGQALPKKKGSNEINEFELHRRIEAVKRFLESPTSTVSGIKKVYQQRAKTINERYDTNFSWQDIANYYESARAENADQKYGSETEVRALGAIRRIADDPDKIQHAIDGHLKLTDNTIVNQVAIDLLQNGLDVEAVFSKK